MSNSAARWRSQRAAARATTRSNLSPGRCSRSHTATRPQASRLARSSAARARCLTALGTRSVSPRRSASRDHALARKRGCKSAHRLATLRYTDKLHITPRVGSRPRFFADARCNVWRHGIKASPRRPASGTAVARTGWRTDRLATLCCRDKLHSVLMLRKWGNKTRSLADSKVLRHFAHIVVMLARTRSVADLLLGYCHEEVASFYALR